MRSRSAARIYLNSGCTSKLDKNGGGAPRQTRLPDGEVTAATKTNVRQRRRRTEMRIGISNRVDIQIRQACSVTRARNFLATRDVHAYNFLPTIGADNTSRPVALLAGNKTSAKLQFTVDKVTRLHTFLLPSTGLYETIFLPRLGSHDFQSKITASRIVTINSRGHNVAHG